jgi:plastocyanin
MREITRRPSAVTALTAVAAVVVLMLAGCGGGSDDTGAAGDEQTSSPSAEASASESPTGSPSESPDESPSESPGDDATDDSTDSPGDVETEDNAVEIEIEIENGRVTPSGERVDVQVGERIRFKVDSDVADELHVHSTPEHMFAVKAGDDDKEFEFTLNQPGVVEVELHELGDVVVSLAARP